MASYNGARFVQELLDAHEASPPSFTIHLHPDHWTLNGGSKFLYNNQMASLLDDIRAQKIPTDFLELFDAANLPFYEGCMIVELLDYRPLKGKEPELATPKHTRVVLQPTADTLWSDICLLNHKAGNVWTDEDALHVEAKILMATAPPLCLDPDPHLIRLTSSILRASAPVTPTSLKRKAVAMDLEDDEGEKARRAKIMQYMNPRINRSAVPSYRILEVVERFRQQKQAAAAQQPAPAPAPTTVPPPQPSSYPLTVRQTPVPPSSTPVPSPAQSTAPSAPPVNVPTRKSATPAPAMARSPSAKPMKPAEVKKAAQSPIISTTVSSGAPSTMPAAIPPHMQHYQNGRSTPSPPTHIPRPASTAGLSRSPMPAPDRPMSTVQQAQVQAQFQAQAQAMAAAPLQAQAQAQVRGKTPMPQHGPSPRVPSAQIAAVQAAVPAQQQMQAAQIPQQLSHQMQPPQAHQQVQPPQLPQQMQPPQLPQQVQMQQQLQQLQQPQPQQQPQQPPQHPQAVSNVQMGNTVPPIANAGRRNLKAPQQPVSVAQQTAYYQLLVQQARTPGHPQAPQAQAMLAQIVAARRAVPAAGVQQPPSRPPTTVQQTPQLTHAQPNYQMTQNVRAMQTQPMHPQQQQFPANSHAATAAAPTQHVQQGVPLGQDQQLQMLQQGYQMYGMNYPQMVAAQMQQGRMPQQAYSTWAAGQPRGVVPNISGHPQQMQLGAGKTGMQGSS